MIGRYNCMKLIWEASSEPKSVDVVVKRNAEASRWDFKL
jgi:hypothetical protein